GPRALLSGRYPVRRDVSRLLVGCIPLRAHDLRRHPQGPAVTTTVDALDDPVARDARDTGIPPATDRGPWRVVALGAFLLASPLMVTVGVLHDPRWYPLLDLAQTEMRVRDVFSAHSPLIGLPGRLGTFAHQGSHPGPLSFYALWPFYRLFGASAWALQ